MVFNNLYTYLYFAYSTIYIPKVSDLYITISVIYIYKYHRKVNRIRIHEQRKSYICKFQIYKYKNINLKKY